MTIEKELIKKYNEFFNCLSNAKITFKKKDDLAEINLILKQIKAIDSYMKLTNVSIDNNTTQLKFKFKNCKK